MILGITSAILTRTSVNLEITEVSLDITEVSLEFTEVDDPRKPTPGTFSCLFAPLRLCVFAFESGRATRPPAPPPRCVWNGPRRPPRYPEQTGAVRSSLGPAKRDRLRVRSL